MEGIGKEIFEHSVYLDDAKYYRSAVSRYYYSAFSILTSELTNRGATVNFPRNQETPSHNQIITGTLINEYLKQLSEERRSHLIRDLAELYRRRVQADYSVQRVSREFTKDAHRLTARIFRYLEIRL